MFDQIKKQIKYVAKQSNIHCLTAPWLSGLGSILAFHSVCLNERKSKLENIRGEQVTPKHLEDIILYFKQKKYKTVSLDEACKIIKGEISIANKFVAFTFDDGYLDNYTLAYPVFKKYSVPFTVYITTGYIDGKAVLWPYLLDNLLDQNRRVEFEAENRKYSLRCEEKAEKEKAFLTISEIIKKILPNNYYDELNQIFNPYGFDLRNKTEKMMLDWEHIKEMSKDDLVTIGAHSVHHFQLKRLSLLQVNEDVAGAKRILESIINKKVDHFSYPFGGENDLGVREEKIVKECGFKTAVTSIIRNVYAGDREHCFSVPRIPVNGNDEDIKSLDMFISGFLPCRNKFAGGPFLKDYNENRPHLSNNLYILAKKCA